MVLVDSRIGSADMIPHLIRAGVPAEPATLESADVAFVGRGIADEPITIGIELKRIRKGKGEFGRSDLLESLKSDRFAGHQLIGLQTYDRAWLVTEGLWRSTDDGNVEVYERYAWVPLMDGRRHVMMGDIEMRLFSLIIRGGLSYWHCPTQRDTVRFISGLYRWWTQKSMTEHRSHQALYIAPPDRAQMVDPSETCKMFSCLPGVGWDRAGKLDERFTFRVVDRLTGESITSKELQTVEGIGRVSAEKITATLWNSKEPYAPK